MMLYFVMLICDWVLIGGQRCDLMMESRVCSAQAGTHSNSPPAYDTTGTDVSLFGICRNEGVGSNL